MSQIKLKIDAANFPVLLNNLYYYCKEYTDKAMRYKPCRFLNITISFSKKNIYNVEELRVENKKYLEKI